MRFERPKSLHDALRELSRGGAIVAGGTVMTRLLAETTLGDEVASFIDISGLQELQGIREVDGSIRIGAMTSLADLEELSGALGDAARAIGNPNVRRAATVGGNLAGAFPGADLQTAALVLDAEVTIAQSDARRVLSMEEVSRGDATRGALILELAIPDAPRRRSAYEKLGWRAASAKTIVAVAASLEVESGTIASARIALAGLAARATRAREAEAALIGAAADGTAIFRAAANAVLEIEPDASLALSLSYRRSAASSMLRRALGKAARR